MRGQVLTDCKISRLVKNLGIGAVPHGFRSSFRDWAAERTNHPREVEWAAHLDRERGQVRPAAPVTARVRRPLAVTAPVRAGTVPLCLRAVAGRRGAPHDSRGRRGREATIMDEPRDDGGTGPTLGVLIIGSLFWDNSTREEWRRDRLDLERRQYVRAPIRYGRQSTGRGCSYTMVFSAGLREAEFGTAIVVPCKSRDLVEEAKSLWEAESGTRGTVSGSFGCVGLLINPHGGLPPEQCDRWSRFVAGRRLYGQLTHERDEPVAVDKAGFLQIHWPRLVGGSHLMLDALLATATDPTLVERNRYPSASEIAEAWNTPKGRDHVRYFRGNRKNGIETFQDPDIERHLLHLGHAR